MPNASGLRGVSKFETRNSAWGPPQGTHERSNMASSVRNTLPHIRAQFQIEPRSQSDGTDGGLCPTGPSRWVNRF